jgi:hypothetical protein
VVSAAAPVGEKAAAPVLEVAEPVLDVAVADTTSSALGGLEDRRG